MGSGLRASFVVSAGMVGLLLLSLSGAASASTDGSSRVSDRASSDSARRSAAGSWSGHWSIVDHGTAGAATGNDYPWSVTFVQSGGSLKSTGTPTPYLVTGSASGSSAHFDAMGYGGYVATFSVTLSADGSTFKGTWVDNQGNAGTAVGRGGSKTKKPKISGTVKESTCDEKACTSKGLPGVKVTARGSGGTVTDTTGADGSYSLEVKKGSWKVTPSLGGREFEPDSPTVVVDDDKVANFTTCAVERKTSSVGASRTTRSDRVSGRAASTACGTFEIDWTMPDHIRTAGWNSAPEPSVSYIYPEGGWTLKLFLKNAQGKPFACRVGHTYTWRIAPRGSKNADVTADKPCRLALKVPREGVYTVTVEEHRRSDDKITAR